MTTRSKRRSRMNQRFAEERAQDRAELDDLRQRCEAAQGDSSATVDVAKQQVSSRKVNRDTADTEKQIADLTTRSQGLLATTEALKEELAAQKVTFV
ncbi:hypothetical protein FOZ63_013993 [Perkinsus olseni]|uniref:Uncharacterized protein n=1 Tax=Perkinsus olseni TaxID=32597 RepID=A0A7J6RYB2_PEROL